MPGPGTIAEYICVKAPLAFPKPAHLDFGEAASVALAGLTAWRGLTSKANLQPGETLLITGVGGGVGAAALAIGIALGANVYVTSSRAETLEKAKAIGARGGFNYTEDDWRKHLIRTSGGVDVVFDGAPAASFPNYVRALKTGARVVVYGSTGDADFQVSAPELFLRNLNVMGTNVGNPQEFGAYLAFISKHGIHPVIDKVFPFDQAKDALNFLKKEHGFGKVVISI
jgi:NADPH:quinone reductase-like Zn-dependent oxidoreductase